MNELMFVFILLLPIAWFFGYRHGKTKQLNQTSHIKSGLSKSYFTGLNYLLNEESDKAIDTFVGMLEIDSETVETNLALGNLFRKKGEVERATRIHQNLIARPSLTHEDRKLALLELGHDYMAAGLLDRAENIFKELSQDTTHKNVSLSHLLMIYQQTKDWEKAIAIAAKLNQSSNVHNRCEISHFYCELAEIELLKNSHKNALKFTKQAFHADPNCVRATIISGEIYYFKGLFKQALKSYKELIKQDIAFLPEVMTAINNSYKQLNDEKGLKQFLLDVINQGGGVSSILAYAKILQEQQGDKKAAEFIALQMNQHPSIKGLLKLIELHIEHASENAKPSLKMLYKVVSKLLENKPIYHCGHCGFDSKTLFWQCPGCKEWGSVKPIQGIEGE